MPPNTSSIMGSVPAEKRGVANGIRMTLNMTGGVLSVPFSPVADDAGNAIRQLSQIVGSTQLNDASERQLFLHAINHACLILGIIVLFAVIPSLLRGPREKNSGINVEELSTSYFISGNIVMGGYGR